MEAHVKKLFLRFLSLAVVTSLLLTACIAKPATCNDPLGCITIENKDSIKIAVLLTLSGPDAPYGTDALRGVEIAIAEKKELLGHPIELVKVDDLCNAEGGQQGATQIAADPTIVGVIGATCSSASVSAAKILSAAGSTLISPSSTAPSLTIAGQYQPGFFRTIYNDKAQGKSVAEFAFHVLGLRTMSTLHDGTPYSMELQAAACENFEKLGGDCLGQIEFKSGQDLSAKILWLSKLHTDVVYFPVYTADGIAILNKIIENKIDSARIGSDGLLSTDFIQKTFGVSQGMYLSGPAPVTESQTFTATYRATYGEEPIASYHLQAYDAALMLFTAIEQSAKPSSTTDNTLLIPRQSIRDVIYGVRNVPGLSGTITCSALGDCAEPRIEIFQIQNGTFAPIYP
jgi:branched-chain amino acid transport system substrate-binding protein